MNFIKNILLVLLATTSITYKIHAMEAGASSAAPAAQHTETHQDFSLDDVFEQAPRQETIAPLIEQLKAHAMQNPEIARTICKLIYLANRAIELIVAEELATKVSQNATAFDLEMTPIHNQIKDILDNRLDESTIMLLFKIESEITKINPDQLTIQTLLIILDSREKMGTLWKESGLSTISIFVEIIRLKNKLQNKQHPKIRDILTTLNKIPVSHEMEIRTSPGHIEDFIKLYQRLKYYTLDEEVVRYTFNTVRPIIILNCNEALHQLDRLNGYTGRNAKERTEISQLDNDDELKEIKNRLTTKLKIFHEWGNKTFKFITDAQTDYKIIIENFIRYYENADLFKSVFRTIYYNLFKIAPTPEMPPCVFIFHDLKNLEAREKILTAFLMFRSLLTAKETQSTTQLFETINSFRIFKQQLKASPNFFNESLSLLMINLDPWASPGSENLVYPRINKSLQIFAKEYLTVAFDYYIKKLQQTPEPDATTSPTPDTTPTELPEDPVSKSVTDTQFQETHEPKIRRNKISKKSRTHDTHLSKSTDQDPEHPKKTLTHQERPIVSHLSQPVQTLQNHINKIRRYLLGDDEVEVQGQDYTFINHWNNEESTGFCWIIPNNTENEDQTSYTISQTQSLVPYKSDKFHDVPVAVQRRIKRGLVLNPENVENFNAQNFSERWKIKSVTPESNKIAIALQAIIIPGHWANNYMGKPERVQNLIRQSTNPPEFVHFGYVIFIFNTETMEFHHMCFHEEAQSEAVNRTYREQREFDGENEELVFTTEQTEEQIERPDDGSSAAPPAPAPVKPAAPQEPHKRRTRRR